MKNFSAIILMAGSSTRYNICKNKNLEKINHKPVFLYSLEKIYNNKNIKKIYLVLQEKDKNKVKKYISQYKNIELVIGGSSRKESVYNALKLVETEYVIIHDGARPLLKERYIDECIKAMKRYKGCTIGVPSKDTIKIVDSRNVVLKTTERKNTYLIQTPQCFDTKALLEQHESNYSSNITDDCMLMEQAGYKVKIIDGDYTNIKLTTKEDLDIIKLFIKKDF